MIRVVKSKGMIHLVMKSDNKFQVLGVLTPDEANRLGVTLLKAAAVTAALTEIKGMTHEENYH